MPQRISKDDMTFAGSALKILLMRRSIGPDSSSPAKTSSRQLAYLGILIYTVWEHNAVTTIGAWRRDGNSGFAYNPYHTNRVRELRRAVHVHIRRDARC